MKSLLKVNAACGYVMENSTHTALFRETLLDNFSSENWKARYSIENYINNGWFVGIINDLEERKKVDEYETFIEQTSFADDFGFSTIFNTMEFNDPIRTILKGNEFGLKKVDGGRNMINIFKSKNEELKTLTKEIGELLRRNIYRNLCIEDSSLLQDNLMLSLLETEAPKFNSLYKSMDEVPDQLLHIDVDPESNLYNHKEMFIGLLAVQKQTTYIRVVTGSHVNRIIEGPQMVHRVPLEKYQFWVAHPQIVHGGSSSQWRSRRLHFYHALPKRFLNKTFHLKYH
jgi:hypothetical protein